MSGGFSRTGAKFIKWVGYNKESLPAVYKSAVERYSENGAVKVSVLFHCACGTLGSQLCQKVGEIDTIEILHRNDGSSPVHQSNYNRKDKEDVLSLRITPTDGSAPATHHVYSDGTGTIKVGDKREYSTSTR